MSNGMKKADEMASLWKEHQMKTAVYRTPVDGAEILVIAENVGQPSSLLTVFDLSRERPAMWRGEAMVSDAYNGPDIVSLRTIMATTPAGLGDILGALGVDGTGSDIARRSVEAFVASIEDAFTRSRVPFEGLVDIESKRLSAKGLERVRGTLDHDALHALRLCPDASYRAYAFYAEQGTHRADRLQAAASYPLLAEFMANRISVRRAIDNRQAIGPLIQQAFGGVSKGVLKKVAGLQWPSRGMSAERIMHALATIPPDWVPTDRENWEAFCDVAASVGAILGDVTGNTPQELYAGCQGKWVDFRGRLARACADTRPPEGATEADVAYINAHVDHNALEKANSIKAEGMIDAMVATMNELPEYLTRDVVSEWLTRIYAPPADQESLRVSCRDVSDTLRAFAEKVVIPVAAYRSERSDSVVSGAVEDAAMKAASAVLFSGQSAVAILTTSRHAHSQMPNLLEAGPDLLAEAENDEAHEAELAQAEAQHVMTQMGVDVLPEWAPVSPISMAPNGLFVVPLCTTGLLKEEGSRLHHCVGGYTSSCKNSGHHILSIRTDSGQSLSTAELNPIIAGCTETEVRQHRGPNNRVPTPEAAAALAWWRSEVMHGGIPLNYEGIQEYLAGVSNRVTMVRKVCGYDFTDMDSLKRALYPWGRYVPKKYRSLDVDGFSQTPEIMNVVRAVNPGYDRMIRRRQEDDERLAQRAAPAMGM